MIVFLLEEYQMSRKRITEIMPFLLPLRIKQREMVYYTKMSLDEHHYAVVKALPFSEKIVSTKTHTINHQSGFDIKYQNNKLYNLKLIAKTLDGLVIKPNETFSFNLAVYNDTKKEKFKDGLVIVNGEMKTESGGGICHMSNQLYHAFLYTPLEIIERHPHNIDYFPPKDINALMGIDATVSSGWLDLKVKNTSNQAFQIDIEFDEEDLIINILSDYKIDYEYSLRNENIDYIIDESNTYKKYDLIRETYEKNTLNVINTEHIATDLIKIAYDL